MSITLIQLGDVISNVDLVTILIRIVIGCAFLIPFGWLRYRSPKHLKDRVSVEQAQIHNTYETAIRALFYLTVAIAIGYMLGYPLLRTIFQASLFTTVIGVGLTTLTAAMLSVLFLFESQRYESGDVVEIHSLDIRGMVEDVTWTHTRIRTFDNSRLTFRNTRIRNLDIINRTPGDFNERRLSMPILVTYESDIAEAIDLIEGTAETVAEKRKSLATSDGGEISVAEVHVPSAPTCQIESFGDNGIRLQLRYCVYEPCLVDATQSAIAKELESAIDKDPDVDFAYPHTHLVFDDTSGELSVRQTAPTQSDLP